MNKSDSVKPTVRTPQEISGNAVPQTNRAPAPKAPEVLTTEASRTSVKPDLSSAEQATALTHELVKNLTDPSAAGLGSLPSLDAERIRKLLADD